MTGIQNLTPWFPNSINPVHVGSYQTRAHALDNELSFNYWNGKCWLRTTSIPCEPQPPIASMIQEIEWRGIYKD